jgi:hypothetical protein
MQFEVNGRQYFLNFIPSEGRWFLFTPSAQGFRRVPIVEDDALGVVGSFMVDSEDEGRKPIN